MGEYCSTTAEILVALSTLKEALGAVPFLTDAAGEVDGPSDGPSESRHLRLDGQIRMHQKSFRLEMCLSTSKAWAAFTDGANLPEWCAEGEESTPPASSSAIPASMVSSKRPAVLADGTYATQV